MPLQATPKKTLDHLLKFQSRPTPGTKSKNRQSVFRTRRNIQSRHLCSRKWQPNPRSGSATTSTSLARNGQDNNQIGDANSEPIENTFNRLLNNAQNWLATAKQQTSEALLLHHFSLSLQTTHQFAALGMIALPLLTERSTTRLLKAANKDLNLKLARRSIV